MPNETKRTAKCISKRGVHHTTAKALQLFCAFADDQGCAAAVQMVPGGCAVGVRWHCGSAREQKDFAETYFGPRPFQTAFRSDTLQIKGTQGTTRLSGPAQPQQSKRNAKPCLSLAPARSSAGNDVVSSPSRRRACISSLTLHPAHAHFHPPTYASTSVKAENETTLPGCGINHTCDKESQPISVGPGRLAVMVQPSMALNSSGAR